MSINDYTQPIEDLYGIYQGNPPDNARPMLVQWLDRALTFDMTAQLRARLLVLLAENQQKTGSFKIRGATRPLSFVPAFRKKP